MKIIEKLQEKFQTDSVSFRCIGEDFVVAEVENSAASAQITLHGAHIMNFQPNGEKPILWMSEKSWFEKWKPIRGGVPVCWPWFGAHPEDPGKPSHGFARLAEWELREIDECAPDLTRLVMTLSDSEQTRELWPYSFELEMSFSIGRELTIQLQVCNRDQQPFHLTSALHSYFNISDIGIIKIYGLEDKEFIDTLDDSRHRQSGPVSFNGETDLVYLDSDDTCCINDPGFGRVIKIAKKGSRTTVVWNPWVEKSQRMPDFGNDEFQRMVCVETTNAESDGRTLQPGETHCLQTTITAEKL